MMLCACGPTSQVVEVTRIVPQTVVVTQWVTKVVTTTPLPTATPSPSPTIVPSSTPKPTTVVDMSLQDGKVVVVQYYTLLGLHLYEQAYQMLSPQASTMNKNAFLEGAKDAFVWVKVIKISPAKDEIVKYGARLPSNIDNWYYIKIYAEGEHGMSGSKMNGFQDIYIRLGQENGEWKIVEFSDHVHQ